MGTRGFITFVADGVEKTAYNHCDSYPEGLGADVLNFLWARRHELTCDRHGDASESALSLARRLRVVGRGDMPTPEDVEHLAPFTDLHVGSQSTDDWYCLLRRTQGDPGAMLKAGAIEDAGEFPCDSLMAEWGYVIDFDARAFEVYEGFQKKRHDKGRFASRDRIRDESKYFPVALVASWPFGELPKTKAEFVAAFEGDGE